MKTIRLFLPAMLLLVSSAAVPAAMALRVVAAPEAQDTQVESIFKHYRPMLIVELSFAKRVCTLSKEQETRAIGEGKEWMRQFSKKAAKDGRHQHIGQGLVMIHNGRGKVKSPHDEIRKGIADIINGLAMPEQVKVYEVERERRESFRRRAAVANLVAQLDGQLDLSAQQRKQIVETLLKNSADTWALQLEMFVHMGNQIPSVPDEHVVRFLTTAQTAVWKGLPKINRRMLWGRQHNMFGAAGVIDDVDLDEQAP